MPNKKKPRIMTPKTAYTVDYPEAIAFCEMQESVHWMPKEIKVEKDVQDILVNMSEAERHGVITVLKLFTHYELIAGNEYWGTRVAAEFPRPADIQRMANCFSFYELNIHAPFYNQLNEALHLNTDEFYDGYVKDPTLKARMEFIDKVVGDKDILKSLASFSMVEGAVLYSSFAFLKHFQAQGKNKLLNVVRGINYSCRDENIHAEGGAWLFKTALAEKKELGLISDSYLVTLEASIRDSARDLYAHECRIIDMIFEKGNIDGITIVQMQHFVQSRINICLNELGYTKEFDVTYNPIADWFYKNINAPQLHDFFTGMGADYNRNWDETAFTWDTGEEL